MATLDIGQLTALVGPALDATITVVLWAAYLTAILGFVYWVFTYFNFNRKIMVREYTKGGKTVVKLLKAKRVTGKNLRHPKLKFYGMLGFGGKQINEPGSECIFPYKSTFGNTIMYDFIRKDGLYFPITNAVLGRRYVIAPSDIKETSEDLKEWVESLGYKVLESEEGKNVIYSTEGSGLEVSRDFDAEQSTLNDLIAAAEKYKNRKPIEIAAMYGLMIIMVVGSFVVLFYAFYKTGEIAEAVNKGWEIFSGVSDVVATSKQGPG